MNLNEDQHIQIIETGDQIWLTVDNMPYNINSTLDLSRYLVGEGTYVRYKGIEAYDPINWDYVALELKSIYELRFVV